MNIQQDLLLFFEYRKLLKRKEAEEYMAEAKRLNVPIREYLLAKEITTEVKEAEPVSDFYCMPFIELDMLDVDRELLDMFTLDYMKRNKFVPVQIDKSGTLLIATSKPLDMNCMSAVAAGFAGKVDVVYTPAVQIDRFIDSIAAVMSTSDALTDLNTENDEKIMSGLKISGGEDAALEDVVNNPSVRLVDSIIKEAVPYRASDIHIEPGEKKVRVRYRIDGDLQERAEFPAEAYSAIAARIKIMAGMNIAEKRVPQDGRISLILGGKEYDFRVSSMPSIHGEKFVIRILDKTSFHFTRQDLGFTAEENGVIDKMLQRPHGIVLLTGPTGCGKSTTLYSFLKEVNDPSVNIVTVEDPVEYMMNGITQTQVNTRANMTFATALRAILRQDPDIIMLGEIRDEETAEIAVRAAITGHLVFSTLHTNDAPGAINRLIDMGIPDYLVADALVGVIAQRLVKRLCPACKKRGKTNAKEMEILGIDEPISICRPQGCQFCNQTGYKGRIAVHEIMYINEKMKNEIVRTKNIDSIRAVATENGLVSLYDTCKKLVEDGTTSVQELMGLNVQ